MIAESLAYLGRFYPLRRGQGRLVQMATIKKLASALPDEVTITTRRGVKVRVAPSDYLGRMLYFFGEHEPRNAQVLGRLLRGKQVFWDIGANYGLFSLEMASRYPSLKVLSVEPQPRLQRMLEESRVLNALENIVVHAGAVGAQAGELTLYVPESSLAVASLTLQHSQATRLQVPVTTLDTLAETHEAPQVIKMDVEGAEYDAIRGGERLLTEKGPAILMEANEARTQALGDSPAIQALSRMGYKFYHAEGSIDSACSLTAPLSRGHDIVALKQ